MSEPKTREQFYWAKLGGQDVELPAPKTRTQEFMKSAAERLAGGGGSDAISIAFYAEENDDTYSITTDYTPDEVRDMMTSGKPIHGELYMSYEGANLYYGALNCIGAEFSEINVSGNGLHLFSITPDYSTNVWEFAYKTYTLTPDE